MARKSKRGSGPRPGSNRAERVAARKARQQAALVGPPRPFAGLAAECDLVALRAFVASATARLKLIGDAADGNAVDLATILPGAVPALTRAADGGVEALVALQTDPEPDDVAVSLAQALLWASTAEAGQEFESTEQPVPALTELIDPQAPLELIVHEDFSWWFGADELSPQISAMLERANDTIMPTARLSPTSGIGAPWWVDAGDRAHLRWVRPENEDDLMRALARLHAVGRLSLGPGSRFAGSFRTHGLLVPVFDLDAEVPFEDWYDAVDQFDGWLAEALADDSELTAAERRSRDGIRGRQITLR